MRLTQVSLSYSAETSPILARKSPDGVLDCSRSNLCHWPQSLLLPLFSGEHKR